MNKDNHENLTAVPKTKMIIARELRLMALGAGEYEDFARTPLRIQLIWQAAAEIIEKNS